MIFRDYQYGSKVLGQGLSSIVYKARKYKSKHQFALKIIKEDFLNTQFRKKLLINEIKVVEAVKNHKNFVGTIQHGKHENSYAFVMELCSKGSLEECLQKAKKLSEAQAIYIIGEVIEAYKLLYSLKILHRDIKPANILITDKNEIKLCDFGLSIQASQLDAGWNHRMGTSSFMAPEIIKEYNYTEKSDVWSIGVTYFYMLAGQLPFKSRNYQNVLKQIQQTNLQSIIPPEFSEFSRRFVLRALNPNIKQRMSVLEIFNFRFQNQIKTLKAVSSLKQIRPKEMKNRTLSTLKLNQNISNISNNQSLPINNQNKCCQISKKTETTDNSSVNLGSPSGKRDQIRDQSIKKLSPMNRSPSNPNISPKKQYRSPSKSPLKCNIKLFQKETQRLAVKQMQKITRILINQIDFLQYVTKLVQVVDTCFPRQFESFKQMMNQFINYKFNSLRKFSFVDQERIQSYKKYSLYAEWKDLLNDYKKKIKPSNTVKFRQKDFQNQLSNVLRNIFFEFDKSINTKQNARKLIALDHLICLNDLLKMATKGEQYFLKHSMLDLILKGLESMTINASQIDTIFTAISKKLTEQNHLRT